jgi:vitamin B12 transporter
MLAVQLMKPRLLALAGAAPLAMFAQGTVSLPELTVYSPRVANQSPVGTFAMPVSSLRYEPRVDIHARNLAEGQADVTLRGDIFENTGFQIGAVTLIDPQTGHYFAEIPVAPALLTPPEIVTGAGLSLGASNATGGAVTYGWRPVRTAGAAAIAFGEFGLRRGEIYQGFATAPTGSSGPRFGADVAIAYSKSDGAIPFGEHEFNRANVRLQRADAASQTDLFAGYQAKFFGWPNLYTPFNSNETEDLETLLFALNHRANLRDGQFFEAGVYHRRNKDDYAFNRFAALGAVHPFQHTTRVTGAALSGRQNVYAITLNYRAEVLADKLQSTSLTFGRFRSRTLSKIALVPEKSWRASDGSTMTLKGGASYEDTSHDSGAFAPVIEIAREFQSAAVRRVYASYTKTSQVPTYTALNSSATGGLFRGNPNLGREKSHNLELGASAAFAGWTTDAAVFWRRDDSLVDWTFVRGVTARAANAVDVDVTGFELVARRSWSACDVVIGYTALSKDADYRGARVDASFYALNYARHRMTAAVTARLGKGFELRIDNVARIQADNLLRIVGGNDAITTSLGLAYRPPALRGFEVSVHVENTWDNDFQEVPAVPAAPRQFSAGVSYTW